MENKPFVSAVIPVYNRLELLKEAAGSVFRQTWKDLELIIADDGSDSRIRQWEKELYSEKLPIPVKFIYLSHTGFPGLVRNRGAEAASGQYLAFLDSDDLWLPEKIEKQVRFFKENPSLKIVHTREKWDRNGKEVSQSGQKHKRSGDIFSDALKKCIIGPSTVMIQKDYFYSLGGFREDLEIAEDYELWLRITAESSIGYIDEQLTVKRAGYCEQLSEKYGQIEIFRLKALHTLIGNGAFSAERKYAAKEEFRNKAKIYAAGCRKRGRNEEAEFYERLIQSV